MNKASSLIIDSLSLKVWKIPLSELNVVLFNQSPFSYPETNSVMLMHAVIWNDICFRKVHVCSHVLHICWIRGIFWVLKEFWTLQLSIRKVSIVSKDFEGSHQGHIFYQGPMLLKTNHQKNISMKHPCILAMPEECWRSAGYG